MKICIIKNDRYWREFERKEFDVKIAKETKTTISVRVNKELANFLGGLGYGQFINFRKDTGTDKNLYQWASGWYTGHIVDTF